MKSQRKTRAEFVAEAENLKVLNAEKLGKPIRKATREDLQRVITNEKARRRRQRIKKLAIAGGVVAGVGGLAAAILTHKPNPAGKSMHEIGGDDCEKLIKRIRTGIAEYKRKLKSLNSKPDEPARITDYLRAKNELISVLLACVDPSVKKCHVTQEKEYQAVKKELIKILNQYYTLENMNKLAGQVKINSDQMKTNKK